MKNGSASTSNPWGAPRPTMWNGVLLRSRMEAGFAQWADDTGLEPEYEPCAFASDRGQYLPDFRLQHVRVPGVRDHPSDGVLWVEIKPVLPVGSALIDLRDRMSIILESIPDATLAIVYKDPAPGILLRTQSGGWWPASWTMCEYPYVVGVAVPLPDSESTPWPDGYWKGPAA